MIQSIYDSCLLHIDLKKVASSDSSTHFHIDMKNDHQKTFLSKRNVFSLFDSATISTSISSSFICLSDVVNMQTDDTLILVDMNFAKRKKQTIVETKIMIKSRDELESTEANSLKFNDTIIKRLDSNDSNNIHFNQISQLDYLQLIQNVESSIINSRSKIRIKLSSKEQYVAQRARDAYVASICQSKASFDLFLAAQTIEISSNDITTLNKRFQ